MRAVSIWAIGLALAAVGPLGCRKGLYRPDAPRPRIVTYSPAITGIVCAMGLGGHVVGLTGYCEPPAGLNPPVVGDRARISAEAILAVRPDLLLVQQNIDDFGAVKALAPDVRIEHFTIETLGDVAEAIRRIGRLIGRAELGERHSRAFEARLQSVSRRVSLLPRPSVLFVIGYERPLTGGTGTFVDEMITLAGGANVAAEQGYAGWKNLNRENILAMAPEVLICQTKPGREQAARDYWLGLNDLPAAKEGRIYTVTDDRWSIPSVWSADLAARLSMLIHPPKEAQP